MFVKFTLANDNSQALINTEKIFLIRKNDNAGTTIMSQGGAIAVVKETVEEVAAATKPPIAIPTVLDTPYPKIIIEKLKPKAKKPITKEKKK